MKAKAIKEKIGVESEPMTCVVEKGLLKKFIQTIDDHNPLWQDEEYAGGTTYGGIIAPPTMLLVVGFEQFQQYSSEIFSSFSTNLNGGTELECYQPVRPGDELIISTRLIDVCERDTRTGKATFTTFETTFTKKGEGLVAICRNLGISY
jgi:acyl dehydratase